MSGSRPVPIELVCLDMAGTTVRDDGAVEQAFEAALAELGVAPDDPRRPAMTDYVHETMGTSKIEVFRSLFGEDDLASQANAAFEAAYEAIVSSGAVTPIDGAPEAISALRAAGLKVALLTGFSPATRDALVEALGWSSVADLLLAPAEAGRGRPHPDLVLSALLRLEVSEVGAVAVVGDTASDIESGRRAGARVRVGVLSGADGRERLVAAGATHVLDSVAELAALLAP